MPATKFTSSVTNPIEGREHDADADPLNAAKQVNAALEAVVNANDALANAGTGGAVAAVNDLVVRARHAKDILSALK